jgi:sugar/nucleoside kinase (ribokinase family)
VKQESDAEHFYLLGTFSHIVKPGETINSIGYRQDFGGKGGNQAVAVARSGTKALVGGKVGTDGEQILAKLSSCPLLDFSVIARDDTQPTGRALIQLSKEGDGENSIILLPGANATLTRNEIDRMLLDSKKLGATWVLLQVDTIKDLSIAQLHPRRKSPDIHSAQMGKFILL